MAFSTTGEAREEGFFKKRNCGGLFWVEKLQNKEEENLLLPASLSRRESKGKCGQKKKGELKREKRGYRVGYHSAKKGNKKDKGRVGRELGRKREGLFFLLFFFLLSSLEGHVSIIKHVLMFCFHEWKLAH